MSADQDLQRETAVGAVDEASAFLSASQSTAEPTGSVRATIDSVQQGLQAISTTLHTPGRSVSALLPCLDRVTEASRAHGPGTRSEPVINTGHSMAAAMLRLACAVSRRAQREIRKLNESDTAVLEFMYLLPDLLTTLANELDVEEERSVPRGMCAQP